MLIFSDNRSVGRPKNPGGKYIVGTPRPFEGEGFAGCYLCPPRKEVSGTKGQGGQLPIRIFVEIEKRIET